MPRILTNSHKGFMIQLYINVAKGLFSMVVIVVFPIPFQDLPSNAMAYDSPFQQLEPVGSHRVTVVDIQDTRYGNTGCGVFEQGEKLERFQHKDQHTQRKLLNFEFWINGELSKIGYHFNNKVILSKISITKNVLLNWYFNAKN